jgi:O-antigen ligase
MTARAVRTPRPWTWAALGLAGLVLLSLLRPSSVTGLHLPLAVAVVAVGVLVVRRLWSMHPAPTMCAAIAASVFSGEWRNVGLGGLPLDRLLLAIVALQLLLGAPGVATAPRLRIRGVHTLLALTGIYVVGSAAAAGTLGQEAGFLSLMDQFGLVPFAMFLLAPAVFAGERERGLLLATLVAIGAYLGSMAIFESLGPHSLVFPRYILRLDTALPGEARAGGPFQAVIAEGFTCYACAIAAVIALHLWRGPRARLVAGAVAVTCLFACVLTLERGVWIGVLLASLLTAIVTVRGRRLLIPLTATLALSGGVVLALSPSAAHLLSSRTGDRETVWDRQNQIAAGLRMVEARPLFGFGWGRFAHEDLDYFRQAEDRPMVGYSLASYEAVGKPLPLHETYLSIVVELGLVGALLWAATLLWGIGGSILARGPTELIVWKRGLLGVAACFLTIALFNPYQSAFPVLLLWIWAGVASGASPPRQAPTTDVQDSP